MQKSKSASDGTFRSDLGGVKYEYRCQSRINRAPQLFGCHAEPVLLRGY